MKRQLSTGRPALGCALAAAVIFGSASRAMSQDATTETLDPDALDTLRRSIAFINASPTLEVKTRTGFDVVQDSGQKIEFGETRTATIRRPDHARVEFARRDGVKGALVLDGHDIWLYHEGENMYAMAPQPGDVQASLDFITADLGIAMPLADFFASDLATVFVSGFVVGDSIIAGTPCDHLAFRSEYVDYQIWIAQGDEPLPQRVVITYREEPGQPQFWAQFVEWNRSPRADDRVFTFTPPPDAERIRFAVPDITTEETER